MFENREPFNKILKILTFFGFWDEVGRVHRMMASLAYFIFVLFYCFMVNLSLLQIQKMDEFLQFIMIMPMMIILISSIRIFKEKKCKVKMLLEILTEMEEESIGSKPYFDKTCSFLHNFSKLMAVSTMAFSLVFAVSTILVNKLKFPMFIPRIIMNREETFYCYWLFQVVAMTYFSILSVCLHELACAFLITIRAYIRYFRRELRSLKSSKENYEGDKREMVKCIAAHHKILRLIFGQNLIIFKILRYFCRFMKCYNDVYSMAIILIIILSSFVLCSIAFIVLADTVSLCVLPLT